MNENLPNRSCHFLKEKISFPSNFASIFSAIKHIFSVLFSSNIIYSGQKQPIKKQILRFSSAQVKIRQIPHVNVELTSQFLFKFASFFIVMTHNSPVNFKLINFLLWIKGSHQSLNFETFECSGENLPNSSCHFESTSQPS